MKSFNDIIAFHGHTCPGLAIGYRVSKLALKELGARALDEELVAIVENNSCAVDAIQVMTGCTFGKGNLVFKDYGKQVYTFIKRPSGKGIRVSVIWESPKETSKEKKMWERYVKGEHSEEVIKTVHNRKAKKIKIILNERDNKLFKVIKGKMRLPEEARLYSSIRCSICGEKMMEPRARIRNGKIVCIPCFESKE